MSYRKYDGTPALVSGEPTQHFGQAGAETLSGSAGADAFWLSEGDVARGGAGHDTYWVQAPHGRFQVTEAAGEGVDKVGGWQNITLERFQHIENLFVANDGVYGAGNAGDNVVEGGDGGQQLHGGPGGQDVLVGGPGADIFIVYKGHGNDAIQDFSPGADRVRLKAGLTNFEQVKARLSQAGSDVKLDLGDGEGLMFRNITVDRFTTANFQLQLDVGAVGAKSFGDEFSGPLSLWDKESNPKGVWRPDLGYQGSQGYGSYTLAGNNELQIYTSPYFRDHPGDFRESPFVSNADGTLSIWAKPSTNSEIFGYQYTSGMISTKQSFTQTYGYFEVRADLPSAAGAWPAFWLIPADGSWPPELDVMETLTKDPWASYTTQHSGVGGHTSHGLMNLVPETADGMHTYGALWTSTSLTWYIDGVEVFRTATPADMNKPMFMIANMALGGWGGVVDKSQLPAEFKIDYIRAYTLGSGASTGAPLNGAPAPAPTTTTTTTTTTSPTPTETSVTTSSGSGGLVLTASGPYATLTGGAGADTIYASQGYDVLTGGGGADRFVFAKEPWAPDRITDFQLGADTLDLKALFAASGYTGSNPVADRFIGFESDGVGGTKVLFDRDGVASGQPWPNYIIHLEKVPTAGLTWGQLSGQTSTTPVSPPPPPPPPPPPAVAPTLSLTSSRYGDTLVGGTGADTLTAGSGPDLLTGGAGADRFVFKSLPTSAGHITDFQPGADVLDLAGLFRAAGYRGGNPVKDGYLQLVSDGDGGTRVLVDADGARGKAFAPVAVTQLDHLDPSSLSSSDWLFR